MFKKKKCLFISRSFLKLQKNFFFLKKIKNVRQYEMVWFFPSFYPCAIYTVSKAVTGIETLELCLLPLKISRSPTSSSSSA